MKKSEPHMTNEPKQIEPVYRDPAAFIGGYLWRALYEAGLKVVPIETNTLVVSWWNGDDYQLTVQRAGETESDDARARPLLAAAVSEVTRTDTVNMRSRLWRALQEAHLKVVPIGANKWIISFWEVDYKLTIKQVD
jgi:hypothetical protein